MSQTPESNRVNRQDPGLKQVLAFIDSASEQDLELIRQVVKGKYEYLRWKITKGLQPGQKVSFETRGLTLTGQVVKVNKKSVTVQVGNTTPSGKRICYWRISPELLKIIPE